MKTYDYTPKGTCSSHMTFTLDEDHVLRDFTVTGGCNGNLKGIKSLIVGMKAEDIIGKLDGILCGYKTTSCPDQISKGLKLCLSGELEGRETI